MLLTAMSFLQPLKCIFQSMKMYGNSNDHGDLTAFGFLKRDLGSRQSFNEDFGRDYILPLSALNQPFGSSGETHQLKSQDLSSIPHSEPPGMKAD